MQNRKEIIILTILKIYWTSKVVSILVPASYVLKTKCAICLDCNPVQICMTVYHSGTSQQTCIGFLCQSFFFKKMKNIGLLH